jgi:Fic family protein
MLLLKSGYAYVPYSSIEAIIESAKTSYYAALQRTQKNIGFSADQAEVDYEPWLSFFLTTLQKQKRHLEAKFMEFAAYNNANLPRTARLILNLFSEKPEWTASDVTARLELNAETTKKNLKLLVCGGFIAKRGTTKGAWYQAVKIRR